MKTLFMATDKDGDMVAMTPTGGRSEYAVLISAGPGAAFLTAPEAERTAAELTRLAAEWRARNPKATQ